MAISTADILFKLSTKAGTAGNQNAGTPAGSLGKYISTTQIADATLHNLFDEVSGEENLASESEYRCLFIHNNNAADTFFNIRIYIVSEVAGGANTSIGVDSTAASALGATAAQAVEIANEDTAPTGVTFSAPTTLSTAINIGDLTAGQVRAVWVRRTTSNSAALANDGATLRVQGESL